MKREPMTVEGVNQLREELEYLKKVMRPKIIAAIAEARAHGDLKENAEYSAAREQQSFNETRISDIEGKLSRAEVIDITKLEAAGKVVFGATVHLVHLETQERRSYQIVGEDEADIKKGKISITSPIARALIGKSVYDFVEVVTPAGIQEFEITAVE